MASKVPCKSPSTCGVQEHIVGTVAATQCGKSGERAGSKRAGSKIGASPPSAMERPQEMHTFDNNIEISHRFSEEWEEDRVKAVENLRAEVHSNGDPHAPFIGEMVNDLTDEDYNMTDYITNYVESDDPGEIDPNRLKSTS